jgi:hypothetical protein
VGHSNGQTPEKGTGWVNRYTDCSDDFYINVHLNTEMDLPSNRDTVLHYFEQLRRKYPTMRNFYARERGEFVLEEEKESGQYRWATVEPRRVCAGQVNPENVADSLDLHRMMLELAPYALSVSPLDCESLNVMFGFDFTYRGNHNQLVAEALGVPPAFEKLTDVGGASVIGYEPGISLAVDEEGKIQCRVGIETRTGGLHLRQGQFPEEQLSVYITARRFGSLESEREFTSTLDLLAGLCRDLADQHVIDAILKPLQQAIALK